MTHLLQPRALYRALATAAVLAAALPVLASAAPAAAITRSDVIARAQSWVDAGIPYSQRGYHAGYRRDCSGFVSMSWALKTSLTTRTLGSVSTKVPLSQLKPGDAVLTPGHVTIFGGYANAAKTAYISLEEANSRLDAVKRVRPLRGSGLRFKGITDAAPAPAAPPAPPAQPAAPARPTLRLLEGPKSSLAEGGANTPTPLGEMPRLSMFVEA